MSTQIDESPSAQLDEGPFNRAMATLAAAGVHTVTIKGTAPSGVTVTIRGGAPKPKRGGR